MLLYLLFLVGLKICAVTAETKKYKSIIKKKKRKRNKIVMLSKSNCQFLHDNNVINFYIKQKLKSQTIIDINKDYKQKKIYLSQLRI